VEAFRQVDCNWDAAAADHGYAWLVEKQAVWLQRPGSGVMAPPIKPPWPPVGCSVIVRAKFNQDYSAYPDYANLVTVGTKKLIEWFGKAMFKSLYVNK